jgi:hypothetical protein
LTVRNLSHFVFLAVFFGLAIYAATSSVVVLAAEAELPWLWWSALLPLAVSHFASGFLATCKNLPGSGLTTLSCAAISGAITIVAFVVAVGMSQHIGLWMPTELAALTLLAASLAGLLGLALAARLWLGSLRKSGASHERRRSPKRS